MADKPLTVETVGQINPESAAELLLPGLLKHLEEIREEKFEQNKNEVEQKQQKAG